MSGADHEAHVGVKFDLGKPRFDLIPPRAITAVADVYTYGATKYADRNWELGIHYSRLYAAAQRHLHSFWGGQDFDPESGLNHLAHAAFGLLAMLEFTDREDLDDRPDSPLREQLELLPASPVKDHLG